MESLIQKLKHKSYEIRKTMLDMCIKAETGHVTSSLSCTDILVSLYYGGILRYDPNNPELPERDRLIISKGQASPLLYTILADLGYFNKSQLNTFAQKNGAFGVHLQKNIPGVEITCGSLGHGFGIAAGMALAGKQDQQSFLVFALLGDGECYEGSIWETAMFASHNQLNNLIALVDRNYLCVTGFTEDIVALEPLESRWASFGWDSCRINGHSFEAILGALKGIRSRQSTRPFVIIADTIKGEGIEFMSNVPLWHGVAPKGEDAEKARRQLQRRYENE